MISERSLSTPIPALLLAAGLGQRLAPLTNDRPKCLVPIHGRPLLAYWLDACVSAGMGPIIVNTHHHAEQVETFLRTSPWRDAVIVSHETELLGTGGTALANRKHLDDGTFLLVHADNLSRFSMPEFVQAHRARPADCLLTMMLFRTPTPESCGIVELDARGTVRAFHEKVANPPGNLANGAVYLMEPEVLDMLEQCGKRKPDISLDLLPRCLGRMHTWENTIYHRDIGTPESYRKALEEFPRLP